MYLEQRVEQLEKQVQELLKLVDKKKVNSISDATIKLDWDRIQKPNNELRKEIIQEAKDFVKEMSSYISNEEGYNSEHPKYGAISSSVHWRIYDSIDFKVNINDKTVTVTIRCTPVDERYAESHKAKAKCMDSDVFNVHIGKAIALGRVLGLDVSRFENAVLPDEVVVGQLLEWEDKSVFEEKSPLYEVVSTKAYEANLFIKRDSRLGGKEAFGGDFKNNDWWQIVDDSNAKY